MRFCSYTYIEIRFLLLHEEAWGYFPSFESYLYYSRPLAGCIFTLFPLPPPDTLRCIIFSPSNVYVPSDDFDYRIAYGTVSRTIPLYYAYVVSNIY